MRLGRGLDSLPRELVEAQAGVTPWSRGLGHHPFKVVTRVRIPVGSPEHGPLAQLVRASAF
jgi:hypothetical protein